MKIKLGDKIENILLTSIDEEKFELNKYIGKKILLSFYRFAACPMCNLRINEIIKNYDAFGDNFIHVAIFDSKLDNLKRFTSKHNAPFPILADEKYEYFDISPCKNNRICYVISSKSRNCQIILYESKNDITNN